MTTREGSCPKSARTRLACFSRATWERSRGVRLSRASPVYEINAVGMQRTSSLMKVGLAGSQTV